ncbi:amidohydrolase [Bremerella sp. P1]|uniref:amidohydrolase n=1 Tax=Bremerella sp. P1 TaxID=3026424 RepID=UPI002368ABD1|nr:amidohydrolase [Bremerella sp. P1]WDI43190.1 amidohydrolase [Bremerella sp. P1]
MTTNSCFGPMVSRLLLATLLLSLIVFGPRVSAAQMADKIYHNGNILTINDAAPEAEAVAIKDGKILAVGTRDEVLKTRGDGTTLVDLAGRTMLPGFVDSHGHAYMIGIQATTANLLPPPDGQGKDIAALQTLLKDWAENNQDAVTKVGWIAGFGYDDSQLAEQRHPTRDDLDEISKDLPVIIIHQSGHLGVANSKALEIAGVTKDTKNPEGGVFRRKEGSQEPNGVCEEYAFFRLIAKLLEQFDDDINEALVIEGTKLEASFGYTTAQEGRAMGPGIAAIKRTADSGKLPIDLVTYPDILEVDDIRPTPEYSGHFRIGGAKLTIDGSPQGKTAWLTEPYFVPPPGQPKTYRGYAAIDEPTTYRAVEKAYANGWQILCHANGDAASDVFLEAVRRAQEKYPGVDNRPVLIHGQVLREDQVEQLKKLGIFPSLFPMHTFYWGDWHRESVLGPVRAENISPTGWVLERGMMFGSHHDAPVALPDSMRVLSATVTRRSRSGKILGAEHRVPVATALKALTIWPAWQHFEEDTKGTIEVGKLADFAILSENPLTIDESKLADIKVLETIKEGVSVYQRPADDKLSLATPAMFGITLTAPSDKPHAHFGGSMVCGDGCFNHGLSLLVNAINHQRSDDEE